MDGIEQIDAEVRKAIKKDDKREKYLKSLKSSPEFKKYIIQPIKEGMTKIQSVESIDITQDSQKILAQIEAQKISYEYLNLLLSFFLDEN